MLRGALDEDAIHRERRGDARDGNLALQLRMPVDKACDIEWICGLPDVVGDVDGEEVAGLDEAFVGLQVDVIGIDEVRRVPAQFGDGRIDRGTGLGGL